MNGLSHWLAKAFPLPQSSPSRLTCLASLGVHGKTETRTTMDCRSLSSGLTRGSSPLLSGLGSASGETGCHRVCGSPPSQPPPVKGGGDSLSGFNNFPLPLRRGRAGVGVTPYPPKATHHGALGFASCGHPLALTPCKTTLSDKRKKAKPDSSGLIPAIHRGPGPALL